MPRGAGAVMPDVIEPAPPAARDNGWPMFALGGVDSGLQKDPHGQAMKASFGLDPKEVLPSRPQSRPSGATRCRRCSKGPPKEMPHDEVDSR